MRYEIIVADGPYNLMEKVNAKLSEGWEIVGPASITPYEAWFQTMIKKTVDSI